MDDWYDELRLISQLMDHKKFAESLHLLRIVYAKLSPLTSQVGVHERVMLVWFLFGVSYNALKDYQNAKKSFQIIINSSSSPVSLDNKTDLALHLRPISKFTHMKLQHRARTELCLTAYKLKDIPLATKCCKEIIDHPLEFYERPRRKLAPVKVKYNINDLIDRVLIIKNDKFYNLNYFKWMMNSIPDFNAAVNNNEYCVNQLKKFFGTNQKVVSSSTIENVNILTEMKERIQQDAHDRAEILSRQLKLEQQRSLPTPIVDVKLKVIPAKKVKRKKFKVAQTSSFPTCTTLVKAIEQKPVSKTPYTINMETSLVSFHRVPVPIPGQSAITIVQQKKMFNPYIPGKSV